ncbi:FtsX-like permease family protein [Streptomyces sp. JJ66]|uniref:ABC transporter permease n=1 Tax=Streptomyces sp. JJ66 TaxID=2803843 RepID=UPI001C58F17C|nr:FtsX-like permease family protein [Streptomyces sp. JJ66]MBW1603378.1 FtsX-like permease family protein [Streptomyces sp. JJ66]
MRAELRWAHADLRAHRGEAVFVLLATAGVTVSLLLAGALFSYAANPWQRVFTQTEGAHVWLHTRAGADTSALGELDGVAATAGPYRTTRTTAATDSAEATVELRAVAPRPPSVAHPLLTSGRWLTAADADGADGVDGADGDADGNGAEGNGADGTNAHSASRARPGVVLEQSLADALWAVPGDTLTVPGTGGGARTLTVVGVAATAEPRYRPGERPGTAWVLPGTLATAAPDGFGQTLGLRLTDPADTDFTVQRAVTALGAEHVTQVTKWQRARAEAGSDDWLLGLLFGAFGLGGLLAAGLAAFSAINARVRGRLRDIAVVKAIGFTPGQVVRTFLAQHLAYALVGVAAATAAVAAFGARLPGRVGEVAGVWSELPGHTAALLGIPALTLLFIAAATTLAAWRAGRVPPVPVARAALPAGGRLSAPARRALGLRLPPALILGWRGAFPGGARRPRWLAPVARLAVPLVLITVALTAWSTLDRFRTDPAAVGLPVALTAHVTDPAAVTDAQAHRTLTAHPGVAAAHPGAEVAALVPGQTGTITLRGLGTADAPYPFTLAEGRAPLGPDEAVAGQGLLDLLDVRVGDWVRMTVEGSPQILHIVGRALEPEHHGRVISTTLDTLRERDPTLRPDFFHLTLRDPADVPAAVTAASVRADLADATGPALDLREPPSVLDALAPARTVFLGFLAVLALITLTELLTATGTTIRDRGRDLLALKAIGLTPRQISAVLILTTAFTALAAAALALPLGVLAGRWLVNAQADASGIGAGIAVAPPPLALAAVTALTVLAALAVSTLPATQAAHRRPADTLTEPL